MIRVMMVMPLTGFVPTMAMALAATVVKRKAITATISTPMSACQILFTTPPKAKKANTASSAMTMAVTTVFIRMSRSVRGASVTFSPGLRRNSPAARPTADLITPADLMMPMMPAVAMPPMPMWRAYSLKICSGAIEPMVWVMPEPIRSITLPPQMRFISGMITSQTRKLPQQMMKEYLRPMM